MNLIPQIKTNRYIVIDSGQCYDTYVAIINIYEPDLVSLFIPGDTPDVGKEVALIGIYKHDTNRNTNVYIVQAENKQVFAMGEKGIKKI